MLQSSVSSIASSTTEIESSGSEYDTYHHPHILKLPKKNNLAYLNRTNDSSADDSDFASSILKKNCQFCQFHDKNILRQKCKYCKKLSNTRFSDS